MDQLPLIKDGADFAAAFNVSRETLGRLEQYVELLRKWQRAVNLVAPSTLDEIWHRHIGDSAQIVDILDESDSPEQSGIWLDLGSGGGFPGLVIAILLLENRSYEFHLVESNGRKCAFLSDVGRRLGLDVLIHNSRIEDPELISTIGPVSIVSARALSSLEQLLELSHPFLSEQTRCFFFKGKEAQAEQEAAAQIWNYHCVPHNSRTNEASQLLEITAPHKKTER